MRMICSFTDTSQPAPALAEVGGKGLSLLRMTQAGLAIPPGLVLTVAFFEPWFQALQALPEWRGFLDAVAGGGELKARCDALKARCGELSFSPEQRLALDGVLASFPEDCL